MWSLLVGLIVPHAPVLLPQLRGGDAPDPKAPVPEEGTPLCVVLSPHGNGTGVYRRVRGNLVDFGVTGIEINRRTDRVFGKELARKWEQPLLDEDVDHGIVVPLLIALPQTLAFVGAALKETTGPNAVPVPEAIEAGKRFADAITAIAEERELIVAASAHTSAALSPQAPLMERPEGQELEDRVTDALENDLGRLTEIDVELWERSGACGAGTLTAFGLLFKGQTARTTFRQAPFGVGYLLAQTA